MRVNLEAELAWWQQENHKHPRDEENDIWFVIIPMMCILSPSLSISSNNAVYFV